MRYRHFAHFLMMVTVLALGACASSDTVTEEDSRPVEDMYNEAQDALEANDYELAKDLFEDVERQHPYSEWATRAQLMAAYAAYENLNYDEAIVALDRFIELHPGHERIDYAYYLKALSLYEQITNVDRDQQVTEDAYQALEALIRRFPDSPYARDAMLKRDLALDHLAGKEMDVGRYYLLRGHTNAAINRFLVVVREYQTTMHVPEALHRLVESYLTLGLDEQAFKIASVLGHNYPGSPWYEKTYALMDEQSRQRIINERDWIDRTVDSLFKPE